MQSAINCVQNISPFDREQIDRIIAELCSWRMGEFLDAKKKNKDVGKVLPFVRGLKFSAKLIYVIREITRGEISVSWGHLVDESGNYCSRECDIIIHQNGLYRQWNGSKDPIMDFHFIRKNKAILVISCKSFISPSSVDKLYCEEVKSYTNNVWLFAECCGPRSPKKIQEVALENGYKEFYYLYIWDKVKDKFCPNYQGWVDFLTNLRNL